MCMGMAATAAGASFRREQGRGAAFGIKSEGITKRSWRGRAGWRAQVELGRVGGSLWEEKHPGSSWLPAIKCKCYLVREAGGKKRL